MTDTEFDTLVARLERRARQDPAGYKLRVLLLALLGNAYLAFMLLVIAALMLVALWSVIYLKALGVKLFLVIGVFLWLILQALWVKIEAPAGARVKKEDSPELFGMIEQLQRQLGSAHFHEVLLTDDFNAGVVQSPRLGIFGWHRNYLLIGLPLMKSLTVEQFKSVLAHEFGHLAKGHGRFSNWIYRLRLRWARLVAVLDNVQSSGRFLFKPFFSWYGPYFSAYSFPLARANEYEADATARRLTSARDAAEALTNTSVIATYLQERYWPLIYKQADEEPQPSFAPFSGFDGRLASGLDADSIKEWLGQATAATTTSADTHPALMDRLAALQHPPQLAPPAAGAAADRLLGDALAVLTKEFDQRWKENVLPSWQQRYNEVRGVRNRLAELDQAAVSAELPIGDAIERAWLTESVGENPDEALRQFRRAHEREPDNASACLSLGTRLLKRDDVEGRPLVERAMQLDDGCSLNAFEMLRDFYARKGDKEEQGRWHERFVERHVLELAGQDERNAIRTDDKLERHGLPQDVIDALKKQIQSVPELRKGYLVKKRVKNFPERPLYIFGFTIARFLRRHNDQRAAAVREQIAKAIQFPGETIIFPVQGSNFLFGRKLRWMRGSRIV